jgi:hypothetical protein
MKMIAIVALAAGNILLGTLLYRAHTQPHEIYADNVQRMHVEVSKGGLLNVTLGDSAAPKATSTLILTPHAAIQLHAEMSHTFALIEQSAGAVGIKPTK